MDKTVCCLARCNQQSFFLFNLKVGKSIWTWLVSRYFLNATNFATGFGVYNRIVDKMLKNPKMMALDPALAALPRQHPAGPSGILKDCWDWGTNMLEYYLKCLNKKLFDSQWPQIQNPDVTPKKILKEFQCAVQHSYSCLELGVEDWPVPSAHFEGKMLENMVLGVWKYCIQTQYVQTQLSIWW